jgi:DNA mismatch endonuclease, patch repair protein
MADTVSNRKRSEVMSLVRSTGNKSTELRLIALMRTAGITGWRRRQKLPGSPDFVFRKRSLAVFVDGCFWHGCPKHATFPATRRAVWRKKFATNMARDRRVNRTLRTAGWRVLRIWEHDLKASSRGLARLLRGLSVAAPQQ